MAPFLDRETRADDGSREYTCAMSGNDRARPETAEWLTSAEVRAMLKISERTLYRRVHAGMLGVYRDGVTTRRWFHRAEVEALLPRRGDE